MGLEDMLGGFARGPSQAFVWSNLSHLSPDIQTHLQKVYLTLAMCLALCAAGVWVNAALAWTSTLGIIAGLVCVPWLIATPARPDTKAKRQYLLAAAALSQGLMIGPLVNAALALAPGVVLTAAGATTAVFASFSAAALLSPRRQYLYLGGYLMAATSTLLVLQLGSLLFGGQLLLYRAHLYAGLLIFSAYVVYDTQVIIERAAAGTRDELRDALDLLLDAVAIFVRVLIILLNSKKQKEEEEKEGSRRGNRRGARTSRLHRA